MKKLDLLVTGGAGYIGSHMVHMLVRAGHAVTVLDNLSRGHANAVANGATLARLDVEDRGAVRALCEANRFDAVLHFAALAYVGESVTDPAAYYRVNVGGTLSLLDAMRAAGTSRLVFSSTCATYGIPAQLPVDEAAPQDPVNPYGQSKRMVEQVLRDHARAYGIHSVSLRYFNAAGCDPSGLLGERHDPETHLVPLVLAEALRVMRGGDPADTKMQVFGTDFPTVDGSCVRDYVHVTDLCTAHLLALQQLMSGACRGASAFNLGNGAGFSVLQVIDTCRRVSGADIRYRRCGRRVGDPAELVADARRAAEVLGWQPEFPSLERIVQTAWDWMRRQPVPAGAGL
ncbi:MAG TPA: UDP-glucose 4-epimerase GalE [Ramlibacter sp.]|nr:UDP-glucose 4-epimerase GalE [Ramlibacter sp.]